MPPTCDRVGLHGTTSFTFNILLHILILFTLLSLLYISYISKVETAAFTSEIQDSIQNNLPKALVNYDKDGRLKTILQSIPLENLGKLYTKPEASTTVYNTWLFRTMGIIISAIILTVFISGLFLYFSCGKCIPFWDILKENTIIFLFVLAVEGMFFLFIASKYVPAPPSMMVKRVFSDLQNWSS